MQCGSTSYVFAVMVLLGFHLHSMAFIGTYLICMSLAYFMFNIKLPRKICLLAKSDAFN